MRRPKINMKVLREAVYRRAGGQCEVSGIPLDLDTFDLHHRRNKGMGGTVRIDTDSFMNVLALDPGVHNGGPSSVHGRRRWSEASGYLVPKDEDYPGLWPVWLRGQRWVLLSPLGGYASWPGHATTPQPAD
jgi:hypothetical protein